MKKLSWGNLTVCCALCSAFFFADFEILDSRTVDDGDSAGPSGSPPASGMRTW